MKLSSWQKVEQPDDCERIKKVDNYYGSVT